MAGKPIDYDIFAKFPHDGSVGEEITWDMIWFMEAAGLITYDDLDYAYYKQGFSVPKYISKYGKGEG